MSFRKADGLQCLASNRSVSRVALSTPATEGNTPPGNTTGEAGEACHHRQPRSATQATLFLKINSDGSSSVWRKLFTIQTNVKTIKNALKVKKMYKRKFRKEKGLDIITIQKTAKWCKKKKKKK